MGTENELRLAAPESHLVDGIRDNVLLGSQQSVKAERSAERRSELRHGCVRDLILRL